MTEKQSSQSGAKASSPVSRRPPVSFFVWMVILIGLGALMFFQTPRGGSGAVVEMNQTQFEAAVDAGRIQKAVFSSDESKFFKVTGTLKPDSNRLLSAQEEPLRFKSEVFGDDALWGKIRTHVPETSMDSSGILFNTIIGWIALIAFVLLIFFLIRRQMQNAGRGAMQFGRSRARMILPGENTVKFDDVAGVDEAKEEIKEIVDYLKDPLKFQLVGGRIPKGALLLGAPGTGKTLMAKAVAGEANVPFFSISGSDFMEMFVGVGASRVRDMFDQARTHSPCLIFIDEIDAVGRSRFSGIGGGHDEREQTLNAMLVEMDGLENNEGVIILAATNRADVLDPALLRPGRFDRQIVIDLPDIKGRQQILEVHLKKIRVDESVNPQRIARNTSGFSGADLANLVNEAALLAARNNRDRANAEDFEEARDKVSYGRERPSRKITEKERRITAYHEAGHTLVAILTPDSIPVHKVTIIPRGQAYLGATMHMPKEDRYTQSKREMEAHLRVCMGGRIAEELIFSDITSGASGDIQQATRMARAMVCAFGMSHLLGTVQYGERGEHIYLGRDIMKTESFSEETAREIDLEIRRIVNEAYLAAKKLLTENHERLVALAEKLLIDETLDVKAVRQILDLPPETDDADELAPPSGVSLLGN